MIDLFEFSDVSEQLKVLPMVEFSGWFHLTRSTVSTMPNIGILSLKYQRHDRDAFDEILAVLKGKLRL